MQPKSPKCNPLGWVWVEMHGFESENDRLQCLQLLGEGRAHPFKKFLLRLAYGKIWFRVRQSDRRNIAWLNGPAPNHCTRLLQWLRESKQQDDEFRTRMGWPIAVAARPADDAPSENRHGEPVTVQPPGL